jgi:hypothetical protein
MRIAHMVIQQDDAPMSAATARCAAAGAMAFAARERAAAGLARRLLADTA